MKNLDKHEWEFDAHEKYAIQYLEEHGFEVTIKKRYISKDKLVIEKDGWKYDAEIPLGQKGIDYKRLMPIIVENFELTRRIKTSSRDEWLALRKGYIGGSDAAAVIGLNRFSSPWRKEYEEVKRHG